MRDDKDMILQMRRLYAKSNTFLRIFTLDDYTKRTLSKLRVPFNNAYRKIFNLPIIMEYSASTSTMYAENNICNFKAMLRKRIYRFIQRLQDSDNLLIQCICKSWVIKFSIWSMRVLNGQARYEIADTEYMGIFHAVLHYRIGKRTKKH